MKILLIEDNPDHALFTSRILRKSNQEYQVDSVSEASEGLDKIWRENYDLVLCDFRLPRASAMEVLKEIKAKGKDLPFIVITAAGSEKIAVELMKEGAYDYLVKDSLFENNLPVVIQRAIDRYNENKEKKALEEELKKSNEKLKEMYAIKSDFTSMVSHELRTPLTAIKEGITIVLDGSSGEINPQQKQFLEMAKKNVDRLKRLIDQVLDFSKLDSKKMVFKIQKTRINEIINEVASIQKAVAQDKGLYLKTDLDSDISVAEVDADMVTQVLNNLINNAIKFTDGGGVTVASKKDHKDNMVKISVKDTGVGIKEEDFAKLFQKFQQLDTSERRKTGGTGLGLAISKEIIEQLGGKIWVESEYGKGCEFIFVLPIERKYKILVIDDEKAILDICEELLRKNGYITLRSEKGKEGIGIARTDKPDLVILDLRLKDISGYEVIGRLRSSKDTSSIPILAISGYLDEIEKIAAYKDELALPWISKPFNYDEFLAKIKLLLSKKS